MSAETGEEAPWEGPRRIRRGCKTDAMRAWPVEPAANLEGPLAAHSYLQQCIRADPADVARICTPHPHWDDGTWQLEHLRQVALELSGLMVQLTSECTKQSCPQMKASDEWVFLCAAHRLPIECCAIDYMCHTLEGTTAVLNSHRWFPQRGAPPAPEAKKVCQSIARRLNRIFAHVYYHHHPVFAAFEAETNLCKRFLYLIHQHHWMRPHQMIIPLDFPERAEAMTAAFERNGNDVDVAGAQARAGSDVGGSRGEVDDAYPSPAAFEQRFGNEADDGLRQRLFEPVANHGHGSGGGVPRGRGRALYHNAEAANPS